MRFCFGIFLLILFQVPLLAQVNLGDDRVVCNGQYTTLDAGPVGPYSWSTGETTQTIDVYQSGSYWAQVAGKRDTINLTIYEEEYNQAAVWPFGSNNLVKFDTSRASPTHSPGNLPVNNSFDIPAGSSSAVSDEGKLLFFTDSKTLFDKDGKVVATDFAGDPAYSQNSIIVPTPGSEVEYYLFTINSAGLHYSIIQVNNDLSLTIKEKNKFLLAPVDEKITAVKGSDGNATWVMTHGKDSNFFYAFKLQKDGINKDPVKSPAGSKTLTSKGYLKFSPDGMRLAMAADFTEVFYFDSYSGAVSGARHLFHSSAYGVEFSPDGTYLYVTCATETKIDSASPPTPGGSLLKINVTYNYQTQVIAQATPGTVFGALQVGTDRKIYVVKGNNEGTSLGVITKPNDFERLSGYIQNDYKISGNTTLGLPNFPQHYFTKPANFEYFQNFPCEGDSVFIKGMSRLINLPYAKFTVKYDFGDPESGIKNISTILSPSHFYERANRVYYIVAIAKSVCRTDTVRKTTFIFPQPKINISDTSICEGAAFPTYKASTYPPQDTYYYWKSGEDTLSKIRDFTPTAPGRYSIKMIVSGVCDTTDYFTIDITKFPNSTIGPDRNLCIGEAAVLSSSVDTSIYDLKWNTGETTPQIVVKSPNKYRLTTSKGLCSITDSVNVLYFQKPLDPLLKEDTIGCATISLLLDAKNSSGFNFLWSTGSTAQTIEIDSAGKYTVMISNPGCKASYSSNISFYPNQDFPISKEYALCESDNEELTLSAGDGRNWNWIPGNQNTRTVVILKSGEYEVSKNDIITGCNEKYTFKILNICTPKIYFPNAFSPNADITNDLFKPAASNLSSYHMSIFNKWGELIFISSKIQEGWDGTYKGLASPSDNYVYTVEYEGETLQGTKKFSDKGSFILLK